MSDESYDFINMIIMIVISFLFAVLIPGLGLIRHLNREEQKQLGNYYCKNYR